MDKTLQLARFGSMPTWAITAPGLKDSANPLDLAKGIWSEAQLIFSAFDESAGAIMASTEFTNEGKTTRLEKIREGHVENIAKLRARLAPVETAHGQSIAKARKATKSTEDVIADLLVQREIRDLLKEQVGNDPNALMIAYNDAVEAGDFTTCSAIENSPRLWEARPDAETLEQWKAVRLEAEEPTLSAEVRDLSAALKDCENILDDVEADIRQTSGVQEGDGMAALTNEPA